MVIKLYVEGGGDSNSLHSRCREGFRRFLEKAGLEGQMPRIVACGSRQSAYDKFTTARENGDNALLLVDSEVKVTEESPWKQLAKEGFNVPLKATDDHCHLMVLCMESWFMADEEALSAFFGQGFNTKALPKNSNIESISKEEIFKSLEKASLKCKTKGAYGKGEHSFSILATIDPEKVASASPWANRFLSTLKRLKK